jgi:dihydrofolate synthase/folylpolyglutamate synthase
VNYDEAIAYLYGLEASLGWDLKLDRVRAALERLGSPERRYPSVLVAGTNGKGSTSAIVHSVLGEAGAKVGLYTSPHLVSFTERTRIGFAEIDRGRVADTVTRLRRLVEAASIPLTFFEMATVLALLAFAEDTVDLAVLEVGLGGRLDATNAVEPVASAVVSIGFDHQAFLGDTLDAIAREKAGVMRGGHPVVLGPELPAEARAALLDEASRVGARVVDADAGRAELAAVALRGAHMRRNAAVAMSLLDCIGDALPGLLADAGARRAGLARVRWPGRLDVVHERPLVVVDSAHNREGVAALIATLPTVFRGRRPRLLFAALADKPWGDMAADLAPHVASVTVTGVGGRRGVPVDDLASAFAGRLPVAVEPEPARAFDALLGGDAETPVLVAGSIYLVGAVYERLLARSGAASVFEPLRGLAA